MLTLMVFCTFQSTSKWAFFCFRGGHEYDGLGTTQLNSATSKNRWCSLFTNLRITYLMHILIVGRIQTSCFRLHCHSIHQNRKIGSKKVQHSAHLTERGGGGSKATNCLKRSQSDQIHVNLILVNNKEKAPYSLSIEILVQ